MPDAGNPGACLICVYGYYPKNYQCLKVSPFCEGHNVQTGDCFGCKYGLNFLNGKCIDENCADKGDGKCNKCNAGFAVDENGVCGYSDPNCLQSFNSRCE